MRASQSTPSLSNGSGLDRPADSFMGSKTLDTAVVLSVVTPAFNEAENLPLFHARLSAALAELSDLAVLDSGWEWIVVDDGSTDTTSDAVTRLAVGDSRVRGVRLEENGGSHPAILRGLAESRGAAVLILAADLQDPPELCRQLLSRWRQGAQVVWAVRRRHGTGGTVADGGEGWLAVALSRLYQALVRRVAGARGLPAGGTGFCLLDREAVAALGRCVPAPVDVFAGLGRLPVRFATVLYDRSPRLHGQSGWTLRKKVRFALRSLATRPALIEPTGGDEPRRAPRRRHRADSP